MQSSSQDLRDPVLWALDRGEPPTAIARRLEVSRVGVFPAAGAEDRSTQQFSDRRHRRSRIAEMESVRRAWVEQAPGLSLAELSERLAEQGI